MAQMTIKGKVKVAGIAILRVIQIVPLAALLFILMTLRLWKDEVIPDIVQMSKNDWSEISFNVKKVFNSKGAK